MILVDTSVVVDYLRTRDRQMLRLFGVHDAAICGVTRAEILHGQKGPANRRNLIKSLNAFNQMSIPESAWDLVGDHLALLQARALTISFADVAIATTAIVHGIELWTRDSHFSLIQSALGGLQLFVEPP
jgi:predicted nucleic acid-binding protein